MPIAPENIDEAARRRFEADWQAGPPPGLGAYLPPDGADNYLETLVELVCIDLEMRWKLQARSGGGAVGAAEYVARFPVWEEMRGDLLRQEAELSRGRRVPRIPDCEIVRELGRGGMGVVYLANQSALNRRVAVKTLRNVSGAPSQELQRFYHE